MVFLFVLAVMSFLLVLFTVKVLWAAIPPRASSAAAKPLFAAVLCVTVVASGGPAEASPNDAPSDHWRRTEEVRTLFYFAGDLQGEWEKALPAALRVWDEALPRIRFERARKQDIDIPWLPSVPPDLFFRSGDFGPQGWNSLAWRQSFDAVSEEGHLANAGAMFNDFHAPISNDWYPHILCAAIGHVIGADSHPDGEGCMNFRATAPDAAPSADDLAALAAALEHTP